MQIIAMVTTIVRIWPVLCVCVFCWSIHFLWLASLPIVCFSAHLFLNIHVSRVPNPAFPPLNQFFFCVCVASANCPYLSLSHHLYTCPLCSVSLFCEHCLVRFWANTLDFGFSIRKHRFGLPDAFVALFSTATKPCHLSTHRNHFLFCSSL